MKKYIKILNLSLVLLCNANVSAMLENPSFLTINDSEHPREQSSCRSRRTHGFLQSLLTGSIIGSAIILSAVHIGKKIDEISHHIGQIDFDALNGAIDVVQQVDPDNLNEAIERIAEGNHFINRTLELIKECPDARRHIVLAMYNIDRDCFPLSYKQQPFASLTIELE